MIKQATWAFVGGGAVGTLIALVIIAQPQDVRPLGDRITDACVKEFGPDQARINSCKIAAITKVAVESDQQRMSRVLSQVR